MIMSEQSTTIMMRATTITKFLKDHLPSLAIAPAIYHRLVSARQAA